MNFEDKEKLVRAGKTTHNGQPLILSDYELARIKYNAYVERLKIGNREHLIDSTVILRSKDRRSAYGCSNIMVTQSDQTKFYVGGHKLWEVIAIPAEPVGLKKKKEAEKPEANGDV